MFRHLSCILEASASVLSLGAAGALYERPDLCGGLLSAAFCCWVGRCVLTAFRLA